MPRRPDPHKHTLWRERLQRFSEAGLPVERFCAQEGVSCSSFYHWRKKLEQSLPVRQAAKVHKATFRPITVLPSSPGVSIQLPCGTRIEILADQLDAVRAAIGEVARTSVHPGNPSSC